jgi:hypothetical protein
MARVIEILVAVTAAVAGLVAIENVTAQRRFEAHSSRMLSIREGMSDAEVYAAAGPPHELVLDLGDETDPLVSASSCRDANGVTALLYSTEYLGWISRELGASPSSVQTDVVCLDDRRIVVKKYVQTMHFCFL